MTFPVRHQETLQTCHYVQYMDTYLHACIGKAYGATPGAPNWDEEADINYEGIIDIYDLAIVGENYGKTLP